jgi:hypothetical protein
MAQLMGVSMSKKSTLPSKSASRGLNRTSLFGLPPILEGEDSAAYNGLLARVSGDVKSADIFEEIWVRDIVDITWEIFRWRRLKTSLLAAAMPAALERTLAPFMPKRPSETKGNTGFPNRDLSFTPKPPSPGYELAKKWAAGNPAAVNRVNKIMASANITMDAVFAKAFVSNFDHIERIDRLATIAEARRNAILREIDRHRASFAHALHEKVQHVEEAEFKVIEPKAVTENSESKKEDAA